MPLQLRSITGKVPYEIEQQIRDLVNTVNQHEQRLAELMKQTATPPAPTPPKPAA